MRTFLVRGAMVTFFAVMGLFGSAATVQFDGMSADVQTHTAVARMKVDPTCSLEVKFPDYGEGDPFWICNYN